MTRRNALRTIGSGFGMLGLGGILGAAELSRGNPLEVRPPHFAPKAKRVIFLFLNGGPSQVDTFDPKPMLTKYNGQPMPTPNLKTERKTGNLLKSPFEFKRFGQSGIELSEIFSSIGECIDDICVIRSMYTFNPTHTPARSLFHSGSILATRPSAGAWISYGLGTENANLPGFVVLSPDPGYSYLWRAGFLPSEHQGTYFNDAESEPEKMIRYLRNTHMSAAAQRRQLDFIQALNRRHEASFGKETLLDSRIQAMETAYRMQFEALDVFDLRKEPEAIRAEYGSTPFANGCLLARRLVERGVRCVSVYYGNGQQWDDHKDIRKKLTERCPDMDRAAAALIRDLKRRGLLDETLIVWGGEFGRTPVSENGDGRDHNPYGYTMWLAGGGAKRGLAYGATDEFGFKAVENRVSIHDLHATILHLLGVDHEKLTFRYAGRDFRLTDVSGEVVRDILA